jgi:hypothetical protein
VDEAWLRLQALTGPGADDPAALAALDELHAAYAQLYADAEALVHSSIRRVKPPPPPALYLQVARRIPARYRRMVRRALRA